MSSDSTKNVHVVVGAGAIGGAVARQLAESGESVLVLTRSGSGPKHNLIERRARDVTDREGVLSDTVGAAAIYNCANPPYPQWASDWPPIADALLAAAQGNGAVLVTASNLYGYGPAQSPMTEASPLAAEYPKARVRIKMWEDALAAHNGGDVRAVEVRGSDYVGPGAQSHLGDRAVPKVLAGKKVSVLGSPDQPHTWTYTEDMARMMIVAGREEQAWGRAWHAPSNKPRTQREALTDLAELAGVSEPKVGSIPKVMIRLMGVFSPLIRELPDVSYQLEAPFVMDSSAAQETFGLQPTAWTEVLSQSLLSFGADLPGEAPVT